MTSFCRRAEPCSAPPVFVVTLSVSTPYKRFQPAGVHTTFGTVFQFVTVSYQSRLAGCNKSAVEPVEYPPFQKTDYFTEKSRVFDAKVERRWCPVNG